MDDNSINQHGTSNYQASAHGKKSRSKITVNNISTGQPREPAVELEDKKQLPGSSRGYVVLGVITSLATIAGTVLAVITTANTLKAGDLALESLLVPGIWLGAALLIGLVAYTAWRFWWMLRKSHLALLSVSVPGNPVLFGRDGRLYRGALSGVCPHDRHPLRFRDAPHAWHYEPDANGVNQKVIDKRGPMAICKGDRSHRWAFTHAVPLET